MNKLSLLDYMPKTKELIEANKSKPTISERVEVLETTVETIVKSQDVKIVDK